MADKQTALRLAPLDRFLLGRAVALERDPLVAEMCEGEGFARRVLNGAGWAVIGAGLVAAGGLVMHWPGRAEAWALVSRYARPRELAAAAHLVRDTLDKRQRDPAFARIETWVRAEPCFMRFARACGFAGEGLARGWDPKGRDCYLFARVMPGGGN